MNLLKDNWTYVKVSDFAELLRGISYKKDESRKESQKGYKPILRSNNINYELNSVDLVYVPEKKIKSIQYIKKGDIIFAMSSGSKHLVGKSAQSRHNYDGSYGAFCGLLRVSNLMNKKYVGLFFKSQEYRKYISRISKGTNINNLKRDHILEINFPLAPLNEQNRIVEKIEELFSDLDKATEDLKKIQEQLKIYRQAVLKAAFEGKLIERKYKYNFKNLDELCIKITDGEHIKPNTKDKGIYFISAKDVRDNYINFDFPLYVSKESAKKFWNRCSPERGDILIVSRGATVGRMCVIKTEKKFCLLGSVILLKIKKEYNNNFIYWMLNSPNIQIKLLGLSGATAQQAIYLRDIRRVQIPIPIIEIQNQIVQEVESRLSVYTKIEETIEQSLNKIEYFRQSILKKAFEGKLVPQDTNDEPAEMLLERIRQEKVKFESNNKKRKKR